MSELAEALQHRLQQRHIGDPLEYGEVALEYVLHCFGSLNTGLLNWASVLKTQQQLKVHILSGRTNPTRMRSGWALSTLYLVQLLVAVNAKCLRSQYTKIYAKQIKSFPFRRTVRNPRNKSF